MDKILKYLHMTQKAIVEIDEIIDDRIDIDNNGNANTEMKVKIEVDKLRFALDRIRELAIKDQEDEVHTPRMPRSFE